MKNQSGKTTVLVVIAHADDETLGAGGTIAKHTSSGDAVFCLRFTDGVGARGTSSDQAASQRARAAAAAAEILGFRWLAPGDFPDNAMDTSPLIKIAQFIEGAKAQVKPNIVYTHSAADLNIDHRRVTEACLTAFRPQPGEVCSEIRSFEVPSATDYSHPHVTASFHPNLFIDIHSTWAKKLQALKAYAEEMRSAPHCRSLDGLETLAKYRGNQAGLAMAEAFEVLRKIER